MSIWFWVFAVLSTFGFALQWALMTKYVRKGDPLSMSTYRSLSFGISMLPLLFFSSPDNIYAILYYQPQLIFSSLCITINVWLNFASLKSLPIGIAGAFRTLFSMFTAITLGWFWFGESLSLLVLGLVILAFLGGVILFVSKVNFDHLDTQSFTKGILLASIGGIFAGTGVIVMVDIARDLDPFVAGYFWEFEAGIASLGILFIRNKYFGGVIERVGKVDFTKILLASSPTLLGALGLGIASTLGPVGIISAVGVLGIVFTTSFGAMFFSERLKVRQYIGITIIVISLICIKLVQ